MHFMDTDQLLWVELGDIIIRLANFRAARTTKYRYESKSSLPILRQMDDDLEKWALKLPSSWTYETVSCDSRNGFYTAFYHIYPGFSIAATWNQYRIARCLLNELILSCLDDSQPEKPTVEPFASLNQCSQTRNMTTLLCTDICASVPYFLRQLDQDRSPKPGVGALEVMWALFVCASMSCIPEQQRLWALDQLDRIGHEMAVGQAIPLAKAIRSKDSLGASSRLIDRSYETGI